MSMERTDTSCWEHKRKVKAVKQCLQSDAGKAMVDIVIRHLCLDVPSAPMNDFDTKRVLYHDGQKSVIHFLGQVAAGEFDEMKPKTESDE
ncbi:hypothetical protein Rhal01_03755 [Rubritalea halochordaticola]|uniref:Uncharacterized protein n=2 Tax=Rubritalea halochordaticola TaxID=714537 RepID=A0ABP9V6N6_9BACT